MAIKFKTKCKYLNPISYSKLKNPMFTEFKAYLTEDKSKYITLQRTAWFEQCDDNGKFIGDKFIINIPYKNIDIETEIFIPANASSFTIPIGKEIYGFKINYDM